MKMRNIEIAVGAFMLTGVLALVFLAVQVSGFSFRDSHSETYKIYARFSNASGLSERAKITIAGVVVGRVAGVSLDPIDNRAKVEMIIQKDVNYLSRDSIAAIQTAGILGEKYIAISVGGDTEYLGEGGEITDTQSALVLEELIGKVLTNLGGKKE